MSTIQVDNPLANVRRRHRAQISALMQHRKFLHAAARLVVKAGGTLRILTWLAAPDVYITMPVNRIGEVAPLLRLLAKEGARVPLTMTDEPGLGQRHWAKKLTQEGAGYAVNVRVTAVLRPDAKCRFVVERTETVEVPAQPARTESRPVYKLMCEE